MVTSYHGSLIENPPVPPALIAAPATCSAYGSPALVGNADVGGVGGIGGPVRLRVSGRGYVGDGMALPAITIAVLGGIGRAGGVIVAALFVVWLNGGILLYLEGSQGSQYQLFVLGAVLIVSALRGR